MTALPSILFNTYAPDAPQTVVDKEVDTYLTSACQVAKGILEHSTNTSSDYKIGRVNENHYHMWGAPMVVPIHTSPVYVGPGYQRPDDNKPGEALRVMAGIIATVLGGYAIYKVGQTLNHISDAGTEIQENAKFSARVEDWEREFVANGQDNRSIKLLQTICEKKEAIFSRIRQNAMLNLFIGISLVAAAVFTLYGAIFASYVGLGVGLFAGLLVGAAFLFKLGYASSDKRDMQDATVIRDSVNTLKQGNDFYNAVTV